MATSMTVFIFVTCLSLLCTYVLGEGRFLLAHVPEYLKVKTDEGPINANEVPDLFQLALGFSSSKPLSWHGMSAGSIFRRPKAGVLITVEEIQGTDALKPSALQSIPIKQVQPGSLTLDSVKDNIINMYGKSKPVSVELVAGAEFIRSPEEFPKLFEGLPPLRLDRMMPLLKGSTSVTLQLSPLTLNLTHQSDVNFFSELQIMQEVLLKLKENRAVVDDNVPDIYSFELSGFRALQSEYGSDSAQVVDAMNVLADFIQQWGREMIELYGEDLFMGVATVPMEAFMHRQGRSLMQSTDSTTTNAPTTTKVNPATTAGPTPAPVANITPSALNVAPYYDETFPVFFNIFLWMGIILVIAVVVVAMMLGNMDPGDSIIYRMTSQRIKID
ncbi:renin receptor-like isoform X1 [Lytechinus variegatus]|uniref:renin receptor-like isoform X1 n=1 Tax=Lytechinus variegatus TaxID=7654 RepID=UPI001BB12935|nr:renin receptor-like isoform X1 [Lytechinus variegatus]